MDEIFADYLEHNATRNRALDLLPMMAEIDEDRVRRAVDDPKIKARPAFHYRLPNCHIEREDWSLSQPWNVWWVVEELAQRPDDLRDLGAKFLEAERPVLDVSRADWVAFLDQWLKAHQLARPAAMDALIKGAVVQDGCSATGQPVVCAAARPNAGEPWRSKRLEP